MSKFIHGIHDPDGAELMADKPGWIVFTEALGCDPKDTSGVNYSTWTSRGYGVIVRLNNGYYSDNSYPGTIPSPDKYDEFAVRCANFVAASDGCEIVIIGNETNMTAETPNRAGIVPSDYARCYRLCRDAIHRIKPQAQVLVAGCAPWNNQSGDWLGYWRSVLSNVGPECDGVAIHTYTHGTDPALITSEEMVHGWHWHFRVYQDQLDVMPAILYGQPVYITETDQDDPWADTNRGWVQEAYAEIDRWNQTSLPSIHALCLFRSLAGDRWSFADKNGVKDDFRAAVAHGYPSPIDDLPDLPELPYPPEFPELPELPMPPELEPETIDWDFRLTKRGCVLQPALIPSDIAPLVTIGKWFNEDEAQGRVNVYVRLLDEQGKLAIGVPVTWFWDGGKETKLTERKSDPWLASKGLGAEYSLDFAMYNLAPAYGVRIEGDYHGDIIDGCGLGSLEQPDWKIHVAYFFEWKLASGHAPPILVPPTTEIESARVTARDGLNLRSGPGPSFDVLGTLGYGSTVLYETGLHDTEQQGWLHVVDGWVSAEYVGEPAGTDAETTQDLPLTLIPPSTERENWQRSLDFVLRWEGGWADDPNDPGGATMKGITLGTYTAWCKAQGQPQPTKADLRAISDAEVDQIYYEWYWLPPHCDKLPWPLCLSTFNLSVNAGVGQAEQTLLESNGDFLMFMSISIAWYTTISGWPHYGQAWTRRNADVLREATK